jgi:hypothetical protein
MIAPFFCKKGTFAHYSGVVADLAEWFGAAIAAGTAKGSKVNELVMVVMFGICQFLGIESRRYCLKQSSSGPSPKHQGRNNSEMHSSSTERATRHLPACLLLRKKEDQPFIPQPKCFKPPRGYALGAPFVFPGQGSQSSGILHHLIEYLAVLRTLDEISEVFGKDAPELDTQS